MNTDLRDLTKMMERLANASKQPAAVTDWAADRYAELADKETLRVEDLMHMVEYATAALLDDPDRLLGALDGISEYLRRRRPSQDRATRTTRAAKAMAAYWHSLGLDTRDWDCAGRHEFDYEWYRLDQEGK